MSVVERVKGGSNLEKEYYYCWVEGIVRYSHRISLNPLDPVNV